MSLEIYHPIKQNQTDRCVEYQFHASVSIDGMKNEEACR